MTGTLCVGVGLAFAAFSAAGVEPKAAEWMILSDKPLADVWRKPVGEWFFADAAAVDAHNPRALAATPGKGSIMVNGKGKTNNLVTANKFGDVEFHCEFLIPKGSNAGVKFEGHYEIQIFDSWGVKKPTGADCGGVYPRAEVKPKYHHIDEGIPPLVNACKRPGEWQTLDVAFLPPRFDSTGKKVANAKLPRVMLNGQIIHRNVDLATPTGNAWRNKETATGPILLQADHGPVAFRDVRVRPLPLQFAADSAPTTATQATTAKKRISE